MTLAQTLPEKPLVGLIGMGDMGSLYADKFSAAGYAVVGCDLPGELKRLREKYEQVPNVKILESGQHVVRQADLIVYSVEAVNIMKVAELYGPATKVGAVVLGQCSVKQVEADAFEKHLPDDVSILPCHSLHGPTVDTAGQTFVLVPHRATQPVAAAVEDVFKEVFGYKVVRMSVEEHDYVSANTQVLTHLGFEAMGTAWKSMGCYPWETSAYVGGIDNVKVLVCLRIYSSKPHIYWGLALLNPRAKEQVLQYNASVAELFTLMIMERHEEMLRRLTAARDAVFGGKEDREPLLPDSVLQEFALAAGADGAVATRPGNSHLSILAMVDTWHKLGIQPYQHLVTDTPIFRLRLGVAEYLFTQEGLLEQSVRTACFEKSIRADDFQFTAAVREWCTTIAHGDRKGYEEQFEDTRQFFSDRLAEGAKKSALLIKRLATCAGGKQ